MEKVSSPSLGSKWFFVRLATTSTPASLPDGSSAGVLLPSLRLFDRRRCSKIISQRKSMAMATFCLFLTLILWIEGKKASQSQVKVQKRQDKGRKEGTHIHPPCHP